MALGNFWLVNPRFEDMQSNMSKISHVRTQHVAARCKEANSILSVESLLIA